MPSALFDLSHDGSFISNVVPGKSNVRIAGFPHVDGANDYLKIVIILRDLNKENGPTALISKTSNSKYLRPIIYELMKPKKKRRQNYDEVLNEELMKKFNKYPPSYLTGKKGDIYFLNTRNIHWATPLEKGIRKLIWFYF